MYNIRQIISWKCHPICFNTFRRSSFQVLKVDINYDDPDLKRAEIKSKHVKDLLNYICDFAKAGGGKKGVQRHTVTNKKLLVRHRLKLLFDSDSPVLEIGLLAGLCMDYGTIPAAGSLTVIGKIHGQYCMVGANDATVKGGTFFPITIDKQIRAQQLSLLNYLPCIYLVDSGGAYLPLQADIFPDRNHGGRTFYNEAVLSTLGIPQIALVCGSCTAGGAYCPTMAQEAIIVNEKGTIFLGGPPLVKAATGEIVSEQDLGGADVHCRVSGCTDYYAETEEQAFEMCRESVLGFNMPQIPEAPPFEEPLYSSSDLSLIGGKKILNKTDMYAVLSRVLDGSMFKEFKQKFGHHLITGFGFIHGMLAGVLANCNPLSFQDAQKGSHFIQLCQKRNVPLVFLQNSGYMTDEEWNAEMADLISNSYLKDRAKMVAAHSCADVPKITINVGGCFADDNFTMCSYGFEPNFYFSWPLAHISSSRNHSEQIQKEEEKLLNKLNGSQDISDYEALFEDNTSAFQQASRMKSDGVIHPEDTRKVLALCLDIAERKCSIKQQVKKTILPVMRM